MIITLKGCTASKHLGGLNFYSIIVNKSSGITVTLDKTTVSKDTAASATVSGTLTVSSGYTLSSVKIMMGGVDKTSEWYNSSTGAITISGISANVTITAVAVSESGSSSGSDESGEITGTTTWYIDHTANESACTLSVNIAGRGWAIAETSAAYSKIVGVPINTAHFFTTKDTQQVAVVKIASKGATTGELIDTVTATKDTTGNFAIITFPAVTLADGEYLSLFSADNSDINFMYGNGAITDANGIADSAFYSRVPTVYGSGSAWTSFNGSLGWSFGYTS